MGSSSRRLLGCALLVLGSCTAPDPNPWSPYDNQGGAWGFGSWRPDVDEIGKELANPISTLASINNSVAFTNYEGTAAGADAESSASYVVSAALPVFRTRRGLLRISPSLPLFFDRPVADESGGLSDTDVSIGDLRVNVAYGGVSARGLLLLGGAIATFPTADEPGIGGDQYRAGVQVAMGKVASWGLAGVTVTHEWEYYGADYETTLTAGNYFYALQIGSGWQIAASPQWAYDHEAASTDAWTVPLGIGLARTMIIGETPWRFGIEYWHYIENASVFGLENQIRFSFSPVVPSPY
jgi:hypothetical protein